MRTSLVFAAPVIAAPTIAVAATVVLATAALAPAAGAQLADLQPGENLVGLGSFGFDRTESIDFGDVDNDGDLDVVTGNGGDGGPFPNRIFVNNGGLQAGVEGTFTEETAVRFAGLTDDTTRDMEFADIDGDGDLDLLSVNRGTASTPAVTQWWINQGGLQGGALGVFVDDTANRWGTLVSVPAAEEIDPDDGSGPFGGWSCDCEFGDLDDDGDLDLFYSSYGPNMNGAVDSRVFLNDGAGVFHELWPWANPGADVRLHTLDVDLADLDGDFDLDVFASSRDSQARAYVNNCRGPVGDFPFSDVTQKTLLDTGAGQGGSSNYDGEVGDLDGDGDFDVWMTNYDGAAFGLEERVLRNAGPAAGIGFSFVEEAGWIVGDPEVDESEADFLDFDGDGDLDVYMTNFSGTNAVYTSGVAQGLTGAQGLYHRNGYAGTGGLATWDELDGSNGGTSRGATAGDLDGDGDPDLARAQDHNASNTAIINTLGAADTHAPTFASVEARCDKPLGTATVVHAAVRDNSPRAVVDTYDTDLVYTVDGGPEQRVDMFAQRGQVFRGAIPAVSGSVSYRVESVDRAGNVGVSGAQGYVQSGVTWAFAGPGTPGELGIPKLTGTGSFEPGTLASLELTDAAPGRFAALFYGVAAGPQPIAGGFLVPNPALGPVIVFVAGDGSLSLPFTVPKSAPCGIELWMQYLIDDPLALGGIAVSQALKLRGP